MRAHISFKGTLDTLRQWAPRIASTKGRRAQEALTLHMLGLLAKDLVPSRPGRSEPRFKKRRAKTYPLLSKPRHEVREIPHRSRYRKNPKPALS